MAGLFIISGPSGAGEDSLIEGLIKKGVDIERVVTTTSRPMREGESEKSPYYFISVDEFEKRIKDGEFFEWAQEYNNSYYGVTHGEIDRVQKSGKVGIWKIGYKGVRSAKKLLPGVKAILINAPLDQIEVRIRMRDKGVSDEYVRARMEYTKEWLEHKHLYDVEVMNVNGGLNKAVEEVYEVLREK